MERKKRRRTPKRKGRGRVSNTDRETNPNPDPFQPAQQKENIKNISNGPKENTKDALTHNKIKETCGHDEGNRCEQTSNTRNPEQAKIQS